MLQTIVAVYLGDDFLMVGDCFEVADYLGWDPIKVVRMSRPQNNQYNEDPAKSRIYLTRVEG